MPGNILSADTYFPDLTDEKSVDEKFTEVSDYLYLLLESLRYSMGNLGVDNFNDSEITELGKIIAEPVYMQLTGEDGRMASLIADIDGFSTRLTDAEGHVSTLLQSSELIGTRVTDLEGNMSSLTQTSETLTARVANAEGAAAVALYTANNISLSVTNENGYVSILLNGGTAATGGTIDMTGLVTFTSLQTEGATVINGGNIATGTLRADCLAANEQGYIVFYNGIEVDEAQIKKLVYGYGYIEFGVNSIFQDPERVYLTISAPWKVTLDAAEIYLEGDVYINGNLVS